jgi:hypothetical protein
MINKDNYIAFFIPYVIICTSLYHIVYWGIFGLNGLALISVSDIIKSAVVPILGSVVGTILGLTLFGSIKSSIKRRGKQRSNLGRPVGWEKFASLVFEAAFYFLIWFIADTLLPQKTLLLAAFLIGNLIHSIIDENWIFAQNFKTVINKHVLLLFFIYFPAFAVVDAIRDANQIWLNKQYKYSVIECKSGSKDTLKLIGYSNEQFVFITKTNKMIYFIKSDSVKLRIKN